LTKVGKSCKKSKKLGIVGKSRGKVGNSWEKLPKVTKVDKTWNYFEKFEKFEKFWKFKKNLRLSEFFKVYLGLS